MDQVSSTGDHPLFSGGETHRPLRFLEDPLLRAVFLDPGERSSLAIATDVLPSALKTASASHLSLSGLDHTAHVLAVYASQAGSLQRHARLAYGTAATPSPGLVTRWVR